MTSTKRERKKVAATLSKALKSMNNSGAHWIKGRFRETIYIDGRYEVAYCSVGAIYKASDNVGIQSKAIIALAQVIRPRKSPRDSSLARMVVTSWNDSGVRKWPDVEEKFQQAIKAVEEE